MIVWNSCTTAVLLFLNALFFNKVGPRILKTLTFSVQGMMSVFYLEV